MKLPTEADIEDCGSLYSPRTDNTVSASHAEVLFAARLARELVPLVRQAIVCAVSWSCSCPGGPKACAFDRVEALLSRVEVFDE
jgi:hypothetical protein